MERDGNYMTVGQAREFLDISKVRMSELLRRGDLEVFERGRDRRIKWLRRADVEAYKRKLDELHPHSKTLAVAA